MKLSKTSYLLYRECPHNAWLKLHRPDIHGAASLSAFEQGLIETGNEIDQLARDLFPAGEMIARGDVATTAARVAARAPVLYQPVFETERTTTACDILIWNASTGSYDLHEVKASTNGEDKAAKDRLYTYDLAFQAEVLRACGVPLGRLYLVRLDSAYVRDRDLDIGALFTREDFTERVRHIANDVETEMAQACAVLAQTDPLPGRCTCMTKGRSRHCTTFAHTNPGVPAYSVHDIARIGSSPAKLARLIDAGVLSITDVPDDFPLSDMQWNQIRAAKLDRAFIDDAAIGQFLSQLEPPFSFIDYETYPSAVPRFAGYRPFDQIPFQFSLDIIVGEGLAPEHHEFLHLERSCPDEAFISALEAALPPSGSVVVWNKTFEMGINAKLAKRNPQHARFLDSMNARIVDLMVPFAEQAYVDPAFRGSTSIKSVLPALVPSLSYNHLTVQDGGAASDTWNRLVTGELAAEEAAKARRDLLDYCALDSRAMIEIWRVLVQSAVPTARPAVLETTRKDRRRLFGLS